MFSDVIKKYPRYPFAYNNRGFLYWNYYAKDKYKDNPALKEKYIKKALQDFTMAINIFPDYAEPYLHRGILYYNIYKFEESLTDLNKFLQLEPNNVDGLLNRGNTLAFMGKYEESIQDFNNYINFISIIQKIIILNYNMQGNLKQSYIIKEKNG